MQNNMRKNNVYWKIDNLLKIGTGILLILIFSFSAYAAPFITSLSSTGGTTTNKDNSQDTMYLALQGDKITFSITASGTTGYSWFVNKVNQGINSNIFTWTTPNEKGIWEIRVEAFDGTGTVPKEWLISTLSPSEAPDFIDYFVDGKYNGRTETDPWGRTIMNWTVRSGTPDVSRLNLYVSSGSYTLSHVLNRQTYGTWKFKKMFPEVGDSAIYTEVRMQPTVGTNKRGYSSAMGFHDAGDAHDRFWVLDGSWGNLMGYYWHDSGIYPLRAIWTTVTIIHTPDGMWYYYEDDVIKYRNWCGTDPALSNYLDWMMMSNNNPPKNIVMADGFEAYKDRYIFPSNSISYEQYMNNAEYYSSAYHIIYKNGIVVDKRGATLKEIATAINNVSLFTYDDATRTAHSYDNLVVGYSGELNITNEKLIMHSNYNGEHEFGILHGATLRIVNSTITSNNNNYYTWMMPSTSHFGFPASMLKTDSKFETRRSFSSFGTVEITGSIINNTAYIFFDDTHELVIKDSVFSNLHHDIDTGKYSTSDSGLTRVRQWLEGKKSFWINIKHGIDFDLAKFEIKNVTFTGQDQEMDATIIIDQWHDKLNLYDINFNGNLNTKKSLKVHTAWEGINSDYDLSTFGLVNSKFKNINVQTDNSEVNVKYYLDVKAIDSNNNPISGATVTVTNNVDDINHPAENIKNEWYPQIAKIGKSNTGYFSYKNFDPLRSTVTDSDGRTPLTSDGTHSLVVTDYTMKQASQVSYTYTISVTKSGKTASTLINPDETWYRSNPNVPVKTVNCNIDTETCTLESAEIGSASGTVRDANNIPISGATVSGGGTSTQTNNTGGYFLANIAAGTQQVTASKQGYIQQTKQVIVIKDSIVNLNFELSAAIPPTIVSYLPVNLTPSQYEGTPNTFNVTTDQTIISKWFLDNIQQNETSQSITKTWSYTDAGTHNITHSGENANGTVSKTWIVMVNNIADTTPPVITSVSASGTNSSATITWTTNERATSQVEYGLSTSYGSYTVLDPALVTSHSVTLTGLTSNIEYHYRVKSKDADNNLAISSDYSFITSPYTAITLIASNDTSIKSGAPDLIRNSNTAIDLGRLAGSTYGNYRGLLYFNLSAIPSTAQINSAALTLVWEGENRNQTTVIGVYRPSTWDVLYATWNSRQNGVSWTTSGGDWVDKNGVSYGSATYAEVTYPTGSMADANFDVTSLVQKYVDGTYPYTGFFLKANEVDNTYISFHSSEASNASQRPRLIINTSGVSFAIEDVNQDGRINQTDLDLIKNNLTTNTPCQRCDVNANGIVDIYDVTRVSTKV